MIIRPSAPDDAARVLLFLSILMQEKCPTILQMESLPSLEEETDFLGKFDGIHSIAYVALESDQVVGFIDAHRQMHPQTSHSCEFGMSVLASYRGKGLGTQLLQSVIEWAKAQSLRRIELSVFANNQAAISLYRKRGFRSEGIKKAAIKLLDGNYTDLLLMAKFI